MDKCCATLGLSFFCEGGDNSIECTVLYEDQYGSSYAECVTIVGPGTKLTMSAPSNAPILTPQPYESLCIFSPRSILLVLELPPSSRLIPQGRNHIWWSQLLLTLGSTWTIHGVTSVYSEFTLCQI